MNTTQFKEYIKNGGLDKQLSFLAYSDIESAKGRYTNAVLAFEKEFGEKDIMLFSAPGRTELSGNHTDHQGGVVLAGSVNLDTVAVVSPREDTVVTVVSEGYEPFSADLADLSLHEEEKGTSEAIVRGMAKAVSDTAECKGICGFDAYTTSLVPKGSGLSSSAAFEVLVGKIFSVLSCDDKLSDEFLAEAGHFAEFNYFGKPCGKMDQYACAVGGIVYIDFFKQTPEFKKIDVSFDKLGYSLFIVDAGGNHANLTPEYASVTREMKDVSAFFGKQKLSQVSKEDFFKALPEIKGKVSDRALSRALHYYTEVERVGAQVSALEERDISTYLSLMQKSGDSSLLNLQNIYPVSNEDERSLSLALGYSLNLGVVSRVHGGGFAGTIQALVKNEDAVSYKAQMERLFGENTAHNISIRPVGTYYFEVE